MRAVISAEFKEELKGNHDEAYCTVFERSSSGGRGGLAGAGSYGKGGLQSADGTV
jgi:hypothetical protein